MHSAEQVKTSTLIDTAQTGPSHTNNAGPREAESTEMPVRENMALADASTRRSDGMTTCMIAWRDGLKNCAATLFINSKSSTPVNICIGSSPDNEYTSINARKLNTLMASALIIT